MVELAHPLGIAPSQVVIDRHNVHATSRQRVEISRESRDQGLTLPGTHFSNLALMKHDPANELHVEVTHLQYPAPRLPDGSESIQ